jgi:hypothetical protein
MLYGRGYGGLAKTRSSSDTTPAVRSKVDISGGNLHHECRTVMAGKKRRGNRNQDPNTDSCHIDPFGTKIPSVLGVMMMMVGAPATTMDDDGT